MKNPMTLAVIGAAVISILLGIAGANHEPKGGAFGKQTETLEGEGTVEQTDAASADDTALEVQ